MSEPSMFSRFLARVTRPSREAIARVFSFKRSPSGVYINSDEALKIAAVWACCEYLGKAVGQLPWRVYSGDKDNRKLAERHPVDWLLHKQPNPEMTAFQFRNTMTQWAALEGYAIAEIEWDMRGVPLALWPLDPLRVCPVRDINSGRLKWEVTNDGAPPTILDHSDVFHLPGYGGGVVGRSVMQYAADSLGWARATEIFSGAMFGNGAHPSVVIKHKKRLAPDAVEAMKQEFKQLYQGSSNAGNVLYLDNEMEMQEVGSRNAGAEFIQIRQHQIEEVCRWFGVPPHKIMHLLRATFSNIEHQSIEVVVDSVSPWALKYEHEADAKLFGRRSAYYTKLDLNGLQRGDFKSRVEGYTKLWAIGVLSTNDIRALEDMPSVGPAGDKRVAPLNMTTLEKLGEEPPQPKTLPGATPQQGSDDEDEDEAGGDGKGRSATQQRAAA
jgi:HK97 family phage portal protein